MPTINPAFVQKAYELTSLAYASGIECPVLPGLNNWIFKQLAGETAAAPSTARTTAPIAAATEASFDDATLSAVKSSPKGVGLADLRAILASYKRPPNQIGAALGRLAKKNLIAKGTDQLWRWRAPKARAGGKVDTSIDKRRARKTSPPATVAGNGAGETMPNAAAAG